MWKRYGRWIIPICLVIFIKFFSLFPDAVEKYYATGIYPWIAGLLRILFGWIPFSVGDLFYAFILIWLIVKLIIFIKKLFSSRIKQPYFLYLIKRVVWYGLIMYILFNILWGLNYNRRGIAYQLNLDVKPYTTQELSNVVRVIVDHLNELDSASRIARSNLKNKKTVFETSIQSYKNLSEENKAFAYRSPSVKPSLYSYLGNYLGFTGYYNPFSGEAQVNTTVPVFIQPFTTCHELGHQLGYAKENEANFAGYLSGKTSSNPSFKYSVYFDLYIYAASELYLRDSLLQKSYREQLRPSVREDYKNLRKFFDRYENPFEPYIRLMYGRYLKANNQPAGIKSYDQVIAWLVAYQRKYGEQAL